MKDIPTPRIDAAYNAGPSGYWKQTAAMLKEGKALERELTLANEKIAHIEAELRSYRGHIDEDTAHIEGEPTP